MVAEFQGLTAIVTGGGSGIGLQAASLLADRGANVACLDLDTAGIEAPLIAERCDVTDDSSVRGAIGAVVQRYGRLDIVINNAGVGAQGDVVANDDDEWRRVFEVNVFGIVRVTRAALPYLRQSPFPAVVNTCSIVASCGLPNRALYSATKGSVLALTLAMAADYVGDGIRVNCVNPGTTDTPWIDRILAAVDDPLAERSTLIRRQPMGRLVSAEEVAYAIAYLASPLCASTTATALAVDGGMRGLRVPPPGNTGT